MKNGGKIKLYSLLGLSPVILSGFIPLSSCGPTPIPTECSISVSNLSCELSQTTTKPKDALDLTITNIQTDEWDIIDVTSIKVGTSELVKDSEYKITNISVEQVSLHFGTSIITNDIVIELAIVPHGYTDDYKILLSPGVEGSIKSIAKDTDLEMTIKPTSDKKLINHINSVFVKGIETDKYEFDPKTSIFTMDANYIDGDIEISVALTDRYHRVILNFDEGQEGYVKISNTEAEHGSEYKTDVEIIPGHTYDYAFKNAVINIGSEEEPLDTKYYKLNIDSNFSYKATLTIDKEFIVNTIHLKFELEEKEVGSRFVYYTDGVTTIRSNVVFFDQGGFQEHISCSDPTKKITKIVVYSRNDSGKKTKLSAKDYRLDGDSVIIFPTARKDVDFLVDVFATCKDGTKFTNDTWDNIVYYTSLGWEHFAYMYPIDGEQVNPNYVGLTRDLELKGNKKYQVRVIGQKFNTLKDKTTPEGTTALLTFEFVQLYSKPKNNNRVLMHFGENNDSSKHRQWYRRSDSENWESNVYKCLNTDGYEGAASDAPSFYTQVPDWLKNGVRTVKNWHIELVKNVGEQGYYWQDVDDKFFILNPVQVNVLGGSYDKGVPTDLGYSNVIYPWYNVTGNELNNRRHKFSLDGKGHSYWLSGPIWNSTWKATYVNSSGNNLSGDLVDKDGEERCVVPCFCL